ncbi:MAG: P-loop NTPase fold protein, partial [Candidatus Hodarchaeales archaeon]
NLIRKYDKQNHFFVQFDAWSHEGNTLRRTFIDEYIRSLYQYKDVKGFLSYLKKCEVTKKEKFIRSTKQKSVSDPDVKFSDGLWFALFTILFTLGIALINRGIDVLTFTSENARCNWEIPTGIFSILLIFLISLLCSLIKVKDTKKINDGNTKNGIWNIIVSQFRSQTTAIAESSPEITSITFQELFSDFLTGFNKFIKKNDKRKLIIIIDNLDRMQKTKALSLFSTIQTFFDIPKKENLFNNIWVIIPYDRTGIKNIWESSTTNEGHENVNIIGNYMIEKRMSVIFHVPPIVLSDFHGYFISQLREAFTNDKNHSDKELEKVFQIFDYFPNCKYSKNNDIAKKFKIEFKTPRQIKHLINDIGEIHRQWEYPLPDILFYVLSCRFSLITSENQILEFLNHLERDNYLLSLLSDKIYDVVVCSWFNLDSYSAYQILLGNSIKEKIVDKDKAGLIELKNDYKNYFWIIFNSLPIHAWSPKLIIFSLYVLEQMINYNDIQKDEEKNVIQKIRARFLESDNIFDIDFEEMPQSMIFLNSLCKDNNVADRTIALLLSSHLDFPELVIDEKTLDTYRQIIETRVNIVSEIFVGIRNIGIFSDKRKIEKIFFVDSINKGFELIAAVNKNSNKSIFDLPNIINFENSEVDHALGELVKANVFQDRHLPVLRYFLKEGKCKEWSTLNQELYSLVATNKTNKYLGEMLEALTILKKEGDQNASQKLKKLVSTNNILSHIEMLSDATNIDSRSLAWGIYVQCNERSITQNLRFNDGGVNRQLSKLKKILNSPEEFDSTMDYLVGIFNDYGDWLTFLKQYKEFVKFIDLILKKYCQDDKGINQLILIGFKLELASVYSQLLIDNSLINNKDAQKFLKSGILGLEEKDFLNAINTHKELFDLLVDFSESPYKLNLKTNLRNVLSEIVQNVLKGGKSPLKEDEFIKVLNLLANSEKALLGKMIYDDFKILRKSESNIHQDFYKVYANNIPMEVLLEDQGLISNVFLELLHEASPESLSWLKILFERNPDLKNKYIEKYPSAIND